MNDNDLLRRYADLGDQPAFTEVVNRHIALVYSAALRRTSGNTAMAADIAQQVFIKLAHHAAALSRHGVLAAWLHTATRNAAIDALRTEQQRRVREHEAHIMQASRPEPSWLEIRPVLDSALDRLSTGDRTAILLRYFGGRGYAEIGAALRVSEDAARMRVDRALEKLRRHLGARGIASTAAVLTSELSAHAVATVPGGLAASVANAALAAGAPATAASWALLLIMTKTKLILAGAMVAAGALTLTVEIRANRELTVEAARLQQETNRLRSLDAQNRELAAKIASNAPRRSALVAANPPRAAASPNRALKPRAQWQNVGISTPATAYETQLWALANGNLDVLATTYSIESTTKARVEPLFAALSPEARAKFGTAEKFNAYIHSFAPWTPGKRPATIEAFALLDREQAGALAEKTSGEGWVHASVRDASGRTNKTAHLFRRGESGWQRLTRDPEAQWQKIVAYFDPRTGEPKAPPH